jgi:NAD(P) transhydrogenase subunit alpha
VRILIPREKQSGDRRVPMTPEGAARLVRLGAQVTVEAGCGQALHYSDEDYERGGASIARDAAAAFKEADAVLRLHPPTVEQVRLLREGSVCAGFLDPFQSPERVQVLAEAGVSAIALELLPRTTVAQKMDALSSQASLSGYVAAVLAAARVERVFPMMTTPAGTIRPARVFVIGVGVAGLQAIATARRLGARVDATDVRPAVAEQVASLGARFVALSAPQKDAEEGAYAKAQTEQQIEEQRRLMADRCAEADVVITTAQVFGRRAPSLVTEEMVRRMRPGSVVVDTAIDSGGNVTCSQPDEEIVIDGVRVIAYRNMVSLVPYPASEMYAGNLCSLVEHLWDKDAGGLRIDPGDPILNSCLLTHAGCVRESAMPRRPEGGDAS